MKNGRTKSKPSPPRQDASVETMHATQVALSTVTEVIRNLARLKQTNKHTLIISRDHSVADPLAALVPPAERAAVVRELAAAQASAGQGTSPC